MKECNHDKNRAYLLADGLFTSAVHTGASLLNWDCYVTAENFPTASLKDLWEEVSSCSVFPQALTITWTKTHIRAVLGHIGGAKAKSF